MNTELCNMMNEYGSDKGSNGHNYTKFYYELFINKKYHENNIFELGLGTNNSNLVSYMRSIFTPGASLKAWKSFFPHSKIYGADIDKQILFEEERIKTYYVDQTNRQDIENLWNNEDIKNIEFDIMIDDGLHECMGNIIFLSYSLQKLKNNGIYIIEDIQYSKIGEYQYRIEQLKQYFPYKFDYEFKILNSGYAIESTDNCLLIINKI